MDLTLRGMGISGALIPVGGAGTAGATTGGALASNLAGLGIEAYMNGRELAALDDPVAYLRERNTAVQALANDGTARYTAALTAIINRLGNDPAGNPYDANTVPAWAREIAARKAALDLETDKYLIDIRWPRSGILKGEEAQHISNVAAKGAQIAAAQLAP